jgi:hypothetical protein
MMLELGGTAGVRSVLQCSRGQDQPLRSRGREPRSRSADDRHAAREGPPGLHRAHPCPRLRAPPRVSDLGATRRPARGHRGRGDPGRSASRVRALDRRAGRRSAEEASRRQRPCETSKPRADGFVARDRRRRRRHGALRLGAGGHEGGRDRPRGRRASASRSAATRSTPGEPSPRCTPRRRRARSAAGEVLAAYAFADARRRGDADRASRTIG